MEVAVDLRVEFRSHADLELQGEILGVDVDAVVFVGNRFAEHLKFFFLYIVEDSVAYFFVDDVVFDGFSILLGDNAGRNMTGAETGLRMCLAHFLKFGGYLVRIIFLLDGHGDFTVHIVDFDIFDVHLLRYDFNDIIRFWYSNCKITKFHTVLQIMLQNTAQI